MQSGIYLVGYLTSLCGFYLQKVRFVSFKYLYRPELVHGKKTSLAYRLIKRNNCLKWLTFQSEFTFSWGLYTRIENKHSLSWESRDYYTPLFFLLCCQEASPEISRDKCRVELRSLGRLFFVYFFYGLDNGIIYNHASSMLHCDIYQQSIRNVNNIFVSNNSHIVW